MALDASSDPTFEPTPAPGNGTSVVGHATIEANNDFLYEVFRGETYVFDVVANDLLPVNDPVRVTQISPLPAGISVSIGPDGRHLSITPDAAVANGSYEFTYNVTSESGKQGSALVKFTVRTRVINDGPGWDYHEVLEDTTDNVFYVLQNDRSFSDGQIIAVDGQALGSTVAIAPGGKYLLYAPTAGLRHDSFSYDVRRDDGTIASANVSVRIEARYGTWRDSYQFDRDATAHTLRPLANDYSRWPAEMPRIVSIGQSEFGSLVELSADGQTITYRPAAGFIGREQISYSVKYGPGAHHVSPGTLFVHAVEPVAAVDDWFFVPRNESDAVLTPLANDFSRVNAENVEGGGRSLAIEAVTQGASGGQVVIDNAGSVRYTPPIGFSGDDTFTYTVRDSNGKVQQAHVIVNVGEPPVSIGGREQFRGDAELTQYLLESSIAAWQHLFEQQDIRQIYHHPSPPISLPGYEIQLAGVATTSTRDHSETNTQVAGIDEADIVETDGDFVYAIIGDELVIVDMANLDEPQLASAMKLSFGVSEMYLIGDRLVLIDRGNYGRGGLLLTIDVSDRLNPTVQSRVEVDGRIVDTRAIGEEVTFVVDASIRNMQAVAHRVSVIAETEEYTTELWRYESLAEFTARVRPQIIAETMPKMKVFDAAGNLIETRQLVASHQIYKPAANRPMRLTVVGGFDVTAEVTSAGDRGVATVGLMGSQLEQIYMAHSGVYVLDSAEMVDRSYNTRSQQTRILFFRIDASAGASLVAAGSVRGVALNQFALDEFNGQLRIATTERVVETSSWRTMRTENHLFVLQPQGVDLNVVGSIERLSPTETIRSVRYLGDMAYMSTYRLSDPLLAVDLSNPLAPQLSGMLVVLGYADYLHPVGDDFLIAFGRDDSPTTGQQGAPQVSLFYVGDPSQPRLADRLTMTGASQTFSEAFDDHHAVAFFAEYGVLSLPINWWTESGLRSAAWQFDVETDAAAGTGSLAYTGKIDHSFAVRRSLRIEDALVTVSAGELKTHSIHDISTQRGNLYLAAPLVADTFTVNEDSADNTLAVLANDHLQPNAQIAAVQYDGDDGTFAIAADGRSLVFTPDADFFGYVTAKYSVDVPRRGRHEAFVTVQVTGINDAPRPVDDQFDVLVGQSAVALNVLANDVDPDDPPVYLLRPVTGPIVIGRPLAANAVSDVEVYSSPVQLDGEMLGMPRVIVPGITFTLRDSLKIVAVGATSRGGLATISTDGEKIVYTPAEGYTGEETFTYTVRSHEGLTAEATVTITVGPAANQVGQNDARVQAIETRRIRREEPGNPAVANPPVVHGLRITSQTSRRLVREAAAAAHDAVLRATAGDRQAMRVRANPAAAPLAANVQAAPGPVVVSARRALD